MLQAHTLTVDSIALLRGLWAVLGFGVASSDGNDPGNLEALCRRVVGRATV